jgi:hypothetical protein
MGMVDSAQLPGICNSAELAEHLYSQISRQIGFPACLQIQSLPNSREISKGAFLLRSQRTC